MIHINILSLHTQLENAADRKGPEHIGQRPLGVGRVHVCRVYRRVLQAVEKHRVVRPSAAPDRHSAVRRVGRAAGPVIDAGRRRHRSQIFPVQTSLGTAAGLEGWCGTVCKVSDFFQHSS